MMSTQNILESQIDDQARKLEEEINQERDRFSSDRMDISFGELINLYKNEELKVSPEYQRMYRWTNQQKTDLIESILLGIPIPPIFVAEDENGVWELVDGLQRVTTIISFFGELKSELSIPSKQVDEDRMEDEMIDLVNRWRLEPGRLIPTLEGLNIETLPSKYKINIKRAVCRVEILRGKSNVLMKYELFKRLNSGGSKLTPQEIRNAIYRGISSDFNDLLKELSSHQLFKEYTNLSENKVQELYDQELILRFFSLLGNQNYINKNLENHLNDFMERIVSSRESELDLLKDNFVEVLSLIEKIGDKNIFRNERNSFVPAYFESITIGIGNNILNFKNNIDLLKERITFLKNDPEYKKYMGSASNSKSRIRSRLKRTNEIFHVN